MLKSLKDSRRRFVESVLENLGASERTKDEEFTLMMNRFSTAEKDLKTSLSMIGKANELHDKYYEFLASHSAFFHKLNSTPNGDDTHFPQSDNFRNNNSLSIVKTHEVYENKINHIYRRTLTHLQNKLAADRTREFVNTTVPNIYDLYDKRSKILIDYDSYRRRLKTLREKKASLESSGKGNSSSAQDNLAEIGKFEAKEKNAKEALDIKTQTIIEEVNAAKESYEDQIETSVITMIATQAEMFRRMADELNAVLNYFPQEKVEKVREEFESAVIEGPPATPKKETRGFFGRGELRKKESTSANTVGAVSVPGNAQDKYSEKVNAYSNEAESPYSPPEPRNQTLPVAIPVAVETTTSSHSSVHIPSAPQSEPSPPPTAPSVYEAPSNLETHVLKLVRALYDHVADEEDELSFSVGDIVQVIEFSDDGWWTGEVDGRRGLFPVNYVEVLED